MIVQASPGRTDVISSALTQILLIGSPRISNDTNSAIVKTPFTGPRGSSAGLLLNLTTGTEIGSTTLWQHAPKITNGVALRSPRIAGVRRRVCCNHPAGLFD